MRRRIGRARGVEPNVTHGFSARPPLGIAFALGAVLLGCVSAITLPLPVAQFPNNCRGVGLEGATLAGSAVDPRVTWLVSVNGNRIDLVWPPGYAARFAPDLEVLNEANEVVFRQGDVVEGGCAKGPADDPTSILLLSPPFRSS